MNGAWSSLRDYRAPALLFLGIWVVAAVLLAARGEWSWIGRAGGVVVALAFFVGLPSTTHRTAAVEMCAPSSWTDRERK